jgi:hypothetical protein
METTNIYDFLHLLSLIKIRPNMDCGGEIWHNTLFFFFFSLKESGERFTSKDQNKRLKTHCGFYSFFLFDFFKLGFN